MCKNCAQAVQTGLENVGKSCVRLSTKINNVRYSLTELCRTSHDSTHYATSFTQGFAQLISPISHLLISTFSKVYTAPITTITIYI